MAHLTQRLGEFGRRVQMLLRRKRFDRDMDEEMRLHLELKERELAEEGMQPDEARFAAQRQMGNTLRLREEGHDAWGWNWFEHLAQDLQYAARMLRKNPGFTAVAVVTLALGIGVNASVFSLLDFVLLRPLSVPEPDRVTVATRGDVPFFSYPDYVDFRDRNESFAGLAASNLTESSLEYENETRSASAEPISGNYSSVMQVRPFLGRWFTDENEPVAVISYRVWQRTFGSDPNVLGKQIRAESQWYTVVGVAPANFTGLYAPMLTAIWVPLRVWASQYPDVTSEMKDRARSRVLMFGRLKPGVGLPQAIANLNAIDVQIQKENSASQPATEPIQIEIVHGSPNPNSHTGAVPILVLLFFVVGAVLLIACINVGNLLLARGATRQREFSVRVTLGAGRARLLRQLLTESLLLCFLGTAAGLVVGQWTNRLIQALFLSLPMDAPMAADLAIGYRVFAFAAGVALLATILCGLLPAWRASHVDVTPNLKGESLSPQRSRLGRASMVGQIALSMMLLLCAGLFLRTLDILRTTDPGFAVQNRMFAVTNISQPEFTPESGRQFYSKVLDDLRALPGIRQASLTDRLPLQGAGSDCVSTGEQSEKPFQSTVGAIDSGFLAAVKIPLLAGREFSAADSPNSPPVAIVNETLARQLWPNQSAMGQRMSVGCKSQQPNQVPIQIVDQVVVQVVGVARDTKIASMADPPHPHFYRPFSQDYSGYAAIVLETSSDPGPMLETIRRALKQESSGVRIYTVRRLSDIVEDSYWHLGLQTSLLLIFGLVALLLAVVGLYGVIAYHAAQRTHEIGVRIAIGARPRDVHRLIQGEGLRLAIIGIVIGLAISAGLTRFLARFLHGLNPTDPITFAATALIWLCVASLACYLPARRASRVDPMIALRHE
jgi:predicted permease